MQISQTLYRYLIPAPVLKQECIIAGQETHLEKLLDKENLSIRNGNNTPIYGLPSVLDSLIRGAGRYYETKIENYFTRIGFRFITENIRYASSRGLLNYFQKQEIGLDILSMGLKKSLEITLGTAIIDPNRESERLKRMGRGLFNMVARLGSRIGLVGLKILKSDQFSYKTLADEFLSRTLCRILYLDSDNWFVGIACRTVEQFGINEWVRHLPAYNYILSKLSNPPTKKKEGIVMVPQGS